MAGSRACRQYLFWAGGPWLIRKLARNEPVSKPVFSISLWFLYQVPALSSGLDFPPKCVMIWISDLQKFFSPQATIDHYVLVLARKI
ncbi:hypothetical protein I79_019664 [Cricetulus griseus]|uniref:Uncharacterized protein n=1 Tax=Cricetulus griseus TaxID=10029 RepID=G3I807_CRIGR|nr:hypothetical protein I79_019664 [Cricetulus griseus]